MKIKDQLEKDLREAMLAKDELRKSTLRLALSAVKLAEVEPNATLVDADLVRILQKEVKSRRETIKDAHRAGRQDLADSAPLPPAAAHGSRTAEVGRSRSGRGRRGVPRGYGAGDENPAPAGRGPR